ncbi:uncharacterized protein LOC8268016 isoform X2 [Ricinus communis]|uniref:uncharacterized protein LOC8268016 isoform X2 n=1 Tax=Ricinus communis TaxID=3988 RepID=UPI00201A4D96|nr:uncharacterized protein LOC8268016 isoform X2 [Ricinus communis]
MRFCCPPSRNSKQKKIMARKKTSPSSHSPILIGNCEVTVESNNFSTSKSDPNSLHISTTRNSKIKISVREELNRRCCDDIEQSRAEEKILEVGKNLPLGEEYMFSLVNSKFSDSCYLQILKMYTRELPTMNFAANTGKQSMFLEKCISNGKYCSLLLKSKFAEGSGVVIAAITYQIVPADTQYAEIPIAAVSSDYQRKGFGRLLYKELRKRLWNVGVRAIYCWGDKESEGFWHKLGFQSIAEVDKKGRAGRLPIKADVRRALCFPGGSVLMVSHLGEDISANDSELQKFHFPLRPQKLSSAIDISVHLGKDYNTLGTRDELIPRAESSHPEGLIREEGFCWNGDCEKLDTFGGLGCSKKSSGAGLEKIEADIDAKFCSCYTQNKRRRVWEASLSSLKSKKVKGSHQIDCTEYSGSDRMESCFNECSLAISKGNSFLEVSDTDPLTSNCMENNAKEGRSINMGSEAIVSRGLQSMGDNIQIMLMNIADEAKKIHLTKVIESLGGTVTSDGSISTHVVTGKIRKTLNFCTALCSGAWIVSSSWLKESFQNGRFVDEWPHVLHDEEYMLKYRTGLKDAILRAKARPKALLRGYDICISAHIQPPVKTLSAIVKSAGGNIVSGLNKISEASNAIFVGCEENMEEALSASKKGIQTFSSDWLMNCIMRQELDLQAFQFAESL